jgi:hypothetical protein
VNATPTNGKPIGIIVATSTVGRKCNGSLTDATAHCIRECMDGFPHLDLIGGGAKDLVSQIRSASPEDFIPEFVLTTSDRVWWPPSYIAKAVKILRSCPTVGVVAGLVPYDPRAYKPPGVITIMHEILQPTAYELNKPIKLAVWCPAWSVIRRQVITEIDSFEGTVRTAIQVRQAGWGIVSERSLLVGTVDGDAVYFPFSPPKRLSEPAGWPLEKPSEWPLHDIEDRRAEDFKLCMRLVSVSNGLPA